MGHQNEEVLRQQAKILVYSVDEEADLEGMLENCSLEELPEVESDCESSGPPSSTSSAEELSSMNVSMNEDSVSGSGKSPASTGSTGEGSSMDVSTDSGSNNKSNKKTLSPS